MASRGEEQLRQVLKTLQQLSLGQLSRVLRSGRNRQVINLLGQLGPSGKLIRDVANLAVKRGDAKSLKALQQAIRQSGAMILPPLDKRGQLPKGYSQRQADEITRQAVEWLQARGYQVASPEERKVEAREAAAKRASAQRRQRGTVTLPLPDTNVPHEYSVHHPMVTREMIPVGASSNVHSYGYDWRRRRLYVRFLGTSQGGARIGEGALYGYDGVSPKLFLDLLDASSKGTWVWDNLRIRGTISGHQFDYALRGLGEQRDGSTGGLYVPRKATIGPDGEMFIPREFMSYRTRQIYRSSKPEQVVRPLRPGFPDRPDRGGFRRET